MISFQKRKKETEYMKLKQGGRKLSEYRQYFNGVPERGGRRRPAVGNNTRDENV